MDLHQKRPFLSQTCLRWLYELKWMIEQILRTCCYLFSMKPEVKRTQGVTFCLKGNESISGSNVFASRCGPPPEGCFLHLQQLLSLQHLCLPCKKLEKNCALSLTLTLAYQSFIYCWHIGWMFFGRKFLTNFIAPCPIRLSIRKGVHRKKRF